MDTTIATELKFVVTEGTDDMLVSIRPDALSSAMVPAKLPLTPRRRQAVAMQIWLAEPNLSLNLAKLSAIMEPSEPRQPTLGRL